MEPAVRGISANPANPWSSFEDDNACSWRADLPFELGANVLFPWQEAVLAAGEATQVFRVEEVRCLGYVRERDGDLVPFVRAHGGRLPARDVVWPAGWVLPELHSTTRESRVGTLLTYCAGDGSLAEDWVEDMHTLSLGGGLRLSFPDQPPIDIASEPGDDSPGLARWWTYFGLTTDIFLPWTSDFSHGGTDREPLDNRRLAAYNAPRLNAFLRRVREVVLDLGGTWTALPSRRYATQVDEFGVVLDAPRPNWSR
jgi:hypothetical protein